jgi:DNA invertase Pin-like site-specific DNA recombinase
MILGVVAEYEREMIGLRMLAGKERKPRAGGYAGGRPRYGTRAEGKTRMQDEGEAQVVAPCDNSGAMGRPIERSAPRSRRMV